MLSKAKHFMGVPMNMHINVHANERGLELFTYVSQWSAMSIFWITDLDRAMCRSVNCTMWPTRHCRHDPILLTCSTLMYCIHTRIDRTLFVSIRGYSCPRWCLGWCSWTRRNTWNKLMPALVWENVVFLKLSFFEEFLLRFLHWLEVQIFDNYQPLFTEDVAGRV